MNGLNNNTGNTNPQQCPQGQHWDSWKGMCVADSPLSGGLNGGQGTAPTAPSTPAPTLQTTDTNLGAPSTSGVDLPQPPEQLGGGFGQCAPDERWNPAAQACVPKSSTNEEGEGLMPWINNLISQGITDMNTFFKCDWGNGFIWDPESKTCTDASEYANDPNNDQTQDPNTDHLSELQMRCSQNGGYWDKTTQRCLDAQGNEMDPMLPNCPEGYEWDAIVAKCVPLGTSSTNQQGPESNLPDDFYNTNVIDPNKPIVPDQAPSQFMSPQQQQLNELLSPQIGTQEDDRLWSAKIKRMNEQYDKSREQLEENLNVQGLYYSGARADQLRELEEDRLTRVEYMTAEFQQESFNRELARKKQAIDWALGSRALDIQHSLGQGKLTLEQFQLALEEKLGMGALDIQQQGIDVQVMQTMLESAMAEAATELERENIWLNVVSMLYQMGLNEEEVQNMWAQIAGTNRAPSY